MAGFIDGLLHDSGVDESLRSAVGSLLQNLLLKDDIIVQFTKDPQSKQILLKMLLATKYYSLQMQCVALKAVST